MFCEYFLCAASCRICWKKRLAADVALDRARVRDHVPQKGLPAREHLAAKVARGFAQVHRVVVATRAPLVKLFFANAAREFAVLLHDSLGNYRVFADDPGNL